MRLCCFNVISDGSVLCACLLDVARWMLVLQSYKFAASPFVCVAVSCASTRHHVSDSNLIKVNQRSLQPMSTKLTDVREGAVCDSENYS